MQRRSLSCQPRAPKRAVSSMVQEGANRSVGPSLTSRPCGHTTRRGPVWASTSERDISYERLCANQSQTAREREARARQR